MAGRGWGGSPPVDEADARRRIVLATAECVRRLGAPATTMQVVADELGITRRTMYRYHPTVEDLFAAVGRAALLDFRTRVDEATAGIRDAVTLVVESLAFAIEVVPEEPLLHLLVDVGRPDLYGAQMVSPDIVALCREAVLEGRLDWAVLGYDRAALDVNLMTLAALRGDALREWLRRWLAPAILARGQAPAAGVPRSP